MKYRVTIILTAIVLFILLSVYRENLIPYDANEERRSALLTGDEPTYLLMAQAIAGGYGMNVHPVHEAESWRSFQNRPVLSSGQWSWEHYYGNWLNPVTDRSSTWGNAQKPPFSPLLPAVLAPIIESTNSIRWWNAIIQGVLLSSIAAGIIIRFYPSGENWRVALISFSTIAGFASIPVGYYTAQVFPEIIAAVCVLGYLLLKSSDKISHRSLGAILLCASLWATPRVVPVVLVAAGFEFLDLVTRREWKTFLIIMLGVPVFLLFNLYVWSNWFPPTGSSFLQYFLGNILSWEFVRRLYQGFTRFFWANDIGLVLFSPIMLVASIALLLNLFLLRSKEDFLVAAIIIVSALSVGLYDDYRAGTCPAGRYQVFVACILTYSLATSIRRLPISVLKRMVPAIIFLGLISLSIGMIVAQKPNYWYRLYHPLFGYQKIQSYYSLLPSFKTGIPHRHILYYSLLFSSTFLTYDAFLSTSRLVLRIRAKLLNTE